MSVTVKNVSYTYGKNSIFKTAAVKDVSFSIENGAADERSDRKECKRSDVIHSDALCNKCAAPDQGCNKQHYITVKFFCFHLGPPRTMEIISS